MWITSQLSVLILHFYLEIFGSLIVGIFWSYILRDVYLFTFVDIFKFQLIIEIYWIFVTRIDMLSKMRRDADGLLASCASSGPRRTILAQAQPRNGNGYGFSGIATFACRPTLLLALCILSTDVARIAGATTSRRTRRALPFR